MPIVHSRETVRRFWQNVTITPGCWVWTGHIDAHGYGRFKAKVDGQWKSLYAHVVAWDMLFGPLSLGLQRDHICRIRACINPAHLEAVTSRENTRRGKNHVANYMRGLCKRGHELSGTNVVVYGGQRYCRSCKLKQSRDYKRAKRASRTR